MKYGTVTRLLAAAYVVIVQSVSYTHLTLPTT